jgi:hypothetical protein
MDVRLDDRSLFGNDAGEDEVESVLMSYFVDRPDFQDFLNPSTRLQFARARKGMGKSALLVRLVHQLRNSVGAPPPIILHYVPHTLAAVRRCPDTDDSVTLANYWQQVICAAINIELARDIGFARTDDQITAVETAELSGFKGRNLLGALITRLIGKIKVGAVELKPTPQAALNHEQLLLRLRQEEHTPRPVWFLLDDIDSEFRNTAQHRALIASFFSAVRSLINDTEGISVRATVRSDVWAAVEKTEHLDKVVQYVTDIKWSTADQESILTHRILGYFRRTDPASEIARTWTVNDHAKELMDQVFVPRMRWGEHGVPAAHVLRILAGGRPRWIAQLCRMAAERAVREKTPRIGGHHLNQVMPAFSQQRLADLYREHQHQFGELKALLESFSGAPPRFSTPELLTRLNERFVTPIGADKIPRIDGIAYSEALQLARFLYRMGFMNGNNTHHRARGVPQFVQYENRPDLLDVKTNLDDGLSWEIHPVYRNVLNIQADQAGKR